MSRMVLILILGGFVVYGITSMTLNRDVAEGTTLSVERYSIDQARNIANSAVEMILSQLADSTSWRVTTPATIDMFGGTATYTIKEVTNGSGGGNYGDDDDDDDGGHYGDDDDDDDDGNYGFNFNLKSEETDGLFASLKNYFSDDLMAGGWFSKKNGKGKGKKGDDDDDDDDGGGHDGDDDDDDDDDDGNDNGGGNDGSNSNETTLKIDVTGNYYSVNKSVTVYAKFLNQNGSGDNVPEFMDYAILTENNLTMNGNIFIGDDNNPSWNSNVHTNSNFQMNGNNTIEGFLTYNGTAHSNPSWRMNTAFVPNNNPDGLPNHYQTDKIDIPYFNPVDFKDQATQVYNSNKHFSGNITLGTEENPEIIYVGGDLTISGTVSGYGVFVVKNNVNISGNVNIIAADPERSNLGFYIGQNLNASGNVTIKAQVLANQNINLSGNCNIYGTVTTRGVVNFNGNVDIFYHPANDVLTTPFWEDEDGGGDVIPPSNQRLLVLKWLE